MNVGDLARHAGVSVRSIHHYESVGLLAPDRGGNGYRVFGDDDLRRVHLIRRLQGVGFSLAEIRDMAPCWRNERSLAGRHEHEMRALYESKLAEIALQLDALTTVRREIEARLAALGRGVPEQES